MDISGHWKGAYWACAVADAQDQVSYGIEAWLEVDGSSVRGRMRDETTYWEGGYAEYLEQHRRALSLTDRWIAKRWLRRNPGALLSVQVGEHSDLVGSVRGFDVELVKAYLEPQVNTVTATASEHSTRILSHKVLYTGVITPAGTVIRGRYRTLGVARTEGEFELSKQDE